MVTVMALGGSTNAVLHLLAMAHAVDVPLTLDDFQTISDRTPFIADLKPSGRYVMEDLHKVGRAGLSYGGFQVKRTQRGAQGALASWRTSTRWAGLLIFHERTQGGAQVHVGVSHGACNAGPAQGGLRDCRSLFGNLMRQSRFGSEGDCHTISNRRPTLAAAASPAP